jgi:hypothetical protein
MKIMARIYPCIRKGVNLSFCFLDKISSLADAMFIQQRYIMDKFLLKRKATSQVSSSFIWDMEMQEQISK